MAAGLKYDNCKNCVSQCEHAGKDREFCYRETSCKEVSNNAAAAKMFTAAIKEIAAKPENLDNLENYLSHHFTEWVKKWVNNPEDLATELKQFAEMEM